MAQDPYDILQLAHHAEPEVVEAAYRRLARKYHPDTNSSANATAHMQEINWAYEILKDPAKRASYDRGVKPQAAPKPPPPKSPPPKPPPAQPKPPPLKPKPPPPKPKAESVKEAPQAWWKPRQMGSTERRKWRLVGAIGLILIAIFYYYQSLAPDVDTRVVVPATADVRDTPRPISTPARATPNEFSATMSAISTALKSGTRVWNPTALPPIFGTPLPSIGTVVVYNQGKIDPVWVTEGGRPTGYIPNGSVCNLLEERTSEYYHLGEYYPYLEFRIQCPDLGVIGWIEAEWTE